MRVVAIESFLIKSTWTLRLDVNVEIPAQCIQFKKYTNVLR